MLNNYVEQVILRGRFHTYVANAITSDYKKAIDSVGKYFTDAPLLDYVKFIYLKNIKQQSTNNEFQNYQLKFSEGVKDTSYLNYFNQNFITENSDNDFLISFNKNEKVSSTLSDVFKQNIGKVIYLDLWLSWCAPCRAAMPASKELQIEFKDKGVKFIYLSLDENISDWKNAAMLEGLLGYHDSYLFANQKSSKFLKEIKLEEIPRYLIVNKNTEIINTNAPPPDSKELRKIFDQLLK